MADAHTLDEFGFPLSAAERLRRMQGIAPSQGEFARERGTPYRPHENLDEPGLGFTLAEFEDAFAENEIHKILRRR